MHRSNTHSLVNGPIDSDSGDKNGFIGINDYPAAEVKKPKKRFNGDRFDYMCFHSSTSKLVAKSFARLAYNDYRAFRDHEAFKELDPSLSRIDYEVLFGDHWIEKAFMGFTVADLSRRVQFGMTVPNVCGNMNTASLYLALVSLISNWEPAELLGKTVSMFSYGSGLAISSSLSKSSATRRKCARL